MSKRKQGRGTEPTDGHNRPKGGRNGAHRPRTRSRRRLWLLRLVLAVGGPLVLLGLLEAGWRVSGRMYDWHIFAPTPDGRHLGANLEFGYRYWPRTVARKPVLGSFTTEKAPRTFRVFVLGASAAVGVPDATFGFWQILDVMLEQNFPGVNFEFVNAGVTAINSHVVLPIAEECTNYDPDLFIVYLGNNEFVGPFSSGTSEQRARLSLGAIRAQIAFRQSGIGQLVQAAGQKLGGSGNLPRQWGGMAMYAENHLRHGDAGVIKAVESFEQNLRDIATAGTDSGTPVLLSTVAVNLSHSAPFASLHRADLDDAARRAWQQAFAGANELAATGDHVQAAAAYGRAAAIDDQHAELHFRWGLSLQAAQQLDAAHRHFVLARDYDVLRFRADSRINAAIRKVAGEAGGRVRLVDSEAMLEQWSRQRGQISGANLFYEHVHLNFAGNYLLAWVMYRDIVKILPFELASQGDPAATPPPPDACAEALALTNWGQYNMLTKIYTMVKPAPFTGQFDHARTMTILEQQLSKLSAQATADEAQLAVQAHDRALRNRPDDLLIRFNYAKLLSQLNRIGEARRHIDVIDARLPHSLAASAEATGGHLLSGDRR